MPNVSGLWLWFIVLLRSVDLALITKHFPHTITKYIKILYGVLQLTEYPETFQMMFVICAFVLNTTGCKLN